MKKYYFDTNAFIKYYKDEKGRERIDNLVKDAVKNAMPILISRWTFIEAITVFAKFMRQKKIAKRDFDNVIESMLKDIDNGEGIRPFKKIVTPKSIFSLAESISINSTDWNIQAGDALHVAIVKKLNLECQTIMVTSDNSLKNVCSRFSVESDNPEKSDSEGNNNEKTL